MSGPVNAAPCEGLTVVEIAYGVSDLGLGPAGGVPGMLLAGLGADVARAADPAPIDAGVPWGEVWHHGKRPLTLDEARELLVTADVALVYGPEELVEGRGLGYVDLARANPALVYARCRPSRTGNGTVADHGLLVEAASGFCAQLEGHRPGPIRVDVHAPGMGTASLLTVSVLELLRRRALTGAGGWAETSLYDGMLATLGCMIGRSERAAPEIESYWEKGSTFPNFLYRCADGELIQVWFGGKGMYPALLEVLGDEPSEAGYYTDQMTGKLGERAARWTSFFARRPREEWITRLREAKVACEPVLGPGEALADPHLAEIGLAVRRGDDVVVGSPVLVEPLREGTCAVDRPLRVADFSAFVAGPLAAEVLADLGADVVKVEPPGGEMMRAAAYAVAACQRGKRSLALDLGAPEARPAVERLIGWADVVLHNFRVGVAERLGIDAETVSRINPDAVHCHASAFGATGPRAGDPANDALMQAVTGFEVAAGGAGNDPLGATWIPLDMAGGWLAATGLLAGLYARTVQGRGQRVVTSLIGAGMLLNSGVYLRRGEVRRGPGLGADQTGYGPGYRIYEGSDGAWFALVAPDPAAWAALGSLAPLPGEFAPARHDAAAEGALEKVFAGSPAGEWVARLRGLGLLAEPVAVPDRDGFRRGILDDPVNRELGRAVTYETADWGRFEQLGPLVRLGPVPGEGPPLMLPRVGEHTAEVLTELGFDDAEIGALLKAGVARQLEEEQEET